VLQDYLAQEGLDLPMEVETRSLEEVEEVVRLLEAGKASKVTRIMLDNMAHVDPSLPGSPHPPSSDPRFWYHFST
jgi:hypothetical protein